MPDSQLRSYVVVRRDGPTLTVMGTTSSRTHEQAIDAVHENLDPAERSGAFGAFPETHWREWDYTAEPTVVIHKKRRETDFGVQPPPEPEPLELEVPTHA